MPFHLVDSSDFVFERNVWRWVPLWSYCRRVAPDVCRAVRVPWMNEGDGLDGPDAWALAEALRRELRSGRFDEWRFDIDQKIAAIPKETCGLCGHVEDSRAGESRQPRVNVTILHNPRASGGPGSIEIGQTPDKINPVTFRRLMTAYIPAVAALPETTRRLFEAPVTGDASKWGHLVTHCIMPHREDIAAFAEFLEESNGFEIW